MEFSGHNRRELAESERLWGEWRKAHRRQPRLVLFAERLTELIEGRAKTERAQVRQIAREVIDQVGQEQGTLSNKQLREVILGLRYTWRLGLSLRNWALHQPGLMRRGD